CQPTGSHAVQKPRASRGAFYACEKTDSAASYPPVLSVDSGTLFAYVSLQPCTKQLLFPRQKLRTPTRRKTTWSWAARAKALSKHSCAGGHDRATGSKSPMPVAVETAACSACRMKPVCSTPRSRLGIPIAACAILRGGRRYCASARHCRPCHLSGFRCRG